MADLTHFDAGGAAHMVDVSDKAETARVAVARGWVEMSAGTLALVREGGAAKGDVLGVARLAGIMGAKRTADLIPLCHPLSLSKVSLDLRADDGDKPRRDRGDGPDHRTDRGGDGGADRSFGGCADDL